jgi:hypothetical protein
MMGISSFHPSYGLPYGCIRSLVIAGPIRQSMLAFSVGGLTAKL